MWWTGAPGDRQKVAEIRGELTKLYCEFSDTVLTFMLRTCRHNGPEALKRAAEEAGERFVWTTHLTNRIGNTPRAAAAQSVLDK
jgi:hypothetical protein